jgi:hypothetical protein
MLLKTRLRLPSLSALPAMRESNLLAYIIQSPATTTFCHAFGDYELLRSYQEHGAETCLRDVGKRTVLFKPDSLLIDPFT